MGKRRYIKKEKDSLVNESFEVKIRLKNTSRLNAFNIVDLVKSYFSGKILISFYNIQSILSQYQII